MKEKILYSISSEDVENVSGEIDIPFTKKDLHFIEEKLGDYLGSQWYDAIEFA